MNRESRNLIATLLLVLLFAFSGFAQRDDIPIKFSEFGKVHYGDASARMDNVASALISEPKVKAYIVVYAGRDDYPGLGHRYAYRLKNYLVARQVDSTRIVAVDGGRRENQWTEIWFVPLGAPTPIPSPGLTSQPISDRAPIKFDEYPMAFAGDEDFDTW